MQSPLERGLGSWRSGCMSPQPWEQVPTALQQHLGMVKPGTGRTGHMPVPAPAPRPWEPQSPQRIRSVTLWRGRQQPACPCLLHAGVPTPSGCCGRRSLALLSLTQRGPSHGSEPGVGGRAAAVPLCHPCTWGVLGHRSAAASCKHGGSVAPLLAPQEQGQGGRRQLCARWPAWSGAFSAWDRRQRGGEHPRGCGSAPPDGGEAHGGCTS